MQMSVLHGREQLHAWYRMQRVQHPSIPLNELQDLRPSMLGFSAPEAQHERGGDTDFAGVCHLAKQHVACLGAEELALVSVGDALVRMRDVMRENARVMPSPAPQELADQAQRAFVVRPLAGIRGPPKWHLVLHFAARAGFSGSPLFHTTFLDEVWNGPSGDAGSRMPSHDVAQAGARQGSDLLTLSPTIACDGGDTSSVAWPAKFCHCFFVSTKNNARSDTETQ